MKKKTVGIILLVLGVASVLGAIVNGTFASFAQGFDLSNLAMILGMVVLVVAGVILIIKGKK